jgi:hypothetical protein
MLPDAGDKGLPGLIAKTAPPVPPLSSGTGGQVTSNKKAKAGSTD